MQTISEKNSGSKYYIFLFVIGHGGWVETLDIVVSAFTSIFSLGLLVISVASYHKYKNIKLLFVSLVFLIFLIKSILLSLGIFNDEIAALTTTTFTGLFDLTILILLFIATLKR